MRFLPGPPRTVLTLLGALLILAPQILAPQIAAAQSEERTEMCRRQAESCKKSCQSSCGLLDFICRDKCSRGACRDAFETCLSGEDEGRKSAPTPRPKPKAKTERSIRGPDDARTKAVRPRAEKPAAAAPPRIQSLDAPEPSPDADLTGKILFLPPEQQEPDAEYYGYLLLGEGISDSRRLAVAEAIACRLEALPNAAAAAAVKRLGLFSLPARREAGTTRISAQDVLEAYDFERAAQWLSAASAAAGRSFDPGDAIVFVGSRSARALQMDAAKLPSSSDGLDPVIADASDLSATFAAAWVGQIVDGLESGRVSSRQELQSLMEATSWLDWANQPLLSLFEVGPKEGQSPPKACPS